MQVVGEPSATLGWGSALRFPWQFTAEFSMHCLSELASAGFLPVAHQGYMALLAHAVYSTCRNCSLECCCSQIQDLGPRERVQNAGKTTAVLCQVVCLAGGE